MKNKTLKLLAATLLLGSFVAPLVGCQTGNNSSEESINEGSGLIEVNSKSITLKEGETFQIEATHKNDLEISYESEDEEIVSVSSTGLLLGNNVGKAKVFVFSDDSTVLCRVEVIAATSRIINGKESKLVWSDEFNGNKIDSSVWGFQLGVHDDYYDDHGVDYWGNNEKQAYTDKNAEVKDGNLIITAKREDTTVNRTNGNEVTMEFSSSRMLTREKKTFKYGYIEAKFKTPCIDGLWPAFWMMPEPSTKSNTANEYGGWCASGEIDIYEARGSKPTEVLMTLHYGSGSAHKMSGGSMNFVESTCDKWHTYAVNWREDFMEWYIDGVMYHRATSNEWYSDNARDNARAPFDKEFYVLFNLAVGGNFDSNKMPPSDFKEASMIIDYLRVYE